MSTEDQLSRGLAALGIDLPEHAPGRLLDYAALLRKWNRVYNLTALRDPSAIVSHHLLDSLAVLPHLQGTSLVDVGSGGGLPGIPLAIARPEWHVALVETNHKKATFLQQARIELKLENVAVHNVRVEEWRPDQGFDIVISRALSDLAEFARLAGHLLAPQGRLYAMKGVYPDEEIAQLPEGFRVERTVTLKVPQIDAARHLVIVARKG
jgi:16S rRNA (guanine527-N7)-methyltransferase